MKILQSNDKNKLLTIFSILILTIVFSPLTLQKLAPETVPILPSPTTVEKEKNSLIGELDELMSNFEIRKNSLDKKLINIQKEKEMYDKAINLINSLKNV